MTETKAKTKTQLIDALADKLGDKKTATAAINALAEVFAETIAAGEEVRWTSVLSLKPQLKPARQANNPATGAKITVPAKWVVKAKVGSELEVAAACRKP
jgi:DNA-binding protein HU-beta